jgi:hypothetical protein
MLIRAHASGDAVEDDADALDGHDWRCVLMEKGSDSRRHRSYMIDIKGFFFRLKCLP